MDLRARAGGRAGRDAPVRGARRARRRGRDARWRLVRAVREGRNPCLRNPPPVREAARAPAARSASGWRGMRPRRSGRARVAARRRAGRPGGRAALDAPLDLLLVRKIGVPWQPELAVAAVMDGATPVIVVEPYVQAATGVDRAVHRGAGGAGAEGDRAPARALPRATRARAGEGRTAIVVDDGIATGTTVRAALRGLRRRKPARLVLAVPVAPPEAVEALSVKSTTSSA